MRKEKRLNQFVEAFLTSIKENNPQHFHPFILTRETSIFATGKEFSDGKEKFKEFLDDYYQRCGVDIDSFENQTIDWDITDYANARIKMDFSKVIINFSNSNGDKLKFVLSSIFTGKDKMESYPDYKYMSFNYHNEVAEQKRLEEVKAIENANKQYAKKLQEKGKTFQYKDFVQKYPNMESQEHNLDDEILFFENDLIIDENLELDELEFSIVVQGNLTVKGDIENYAFEYGATLFVLGETYANNIIAGGAKIDLTHVYATGLVIGHYNDGMLIIDRLHKGILYSNDHYTEYELGNDAYAFTDFDIRSKNEFSLSDFKIFAGEKFLTNDEDDDYLDIEEFDASLVDYDRLVQKIKLYQEQNLLK